MKDLALCIRLQRAGFKNAPYFYIDVTQRCKKALVKPIERLGEFNPHPQADGTKVVQLKFERIKYWLGRGLQPTNAVREIFGKASSSSSSYNDCISSNNASNISCNIFDLLNFFNRQIFFLAYQEVFM